jgi:2-methylaconitate cis-trans-isomerase PrpF
MPASARSGRRRWTSFVADAAPPGKVVRGLHEQANPQHRLRVEHDASTLLIHLSDEDGDGWTTIAVDRATRSWAVAQSKRQADTGRDAYQSLYRQ